MADFARAHLSGSDRSQRLLLPEAVDDAVGPDDPVRFIEAFVDGLDPGAAGFARVRAKATGRPGCDPADLLKLSIQGYRNRVRSSRRLEAEARRTIAVIWLVRPLRPDFETIADVLRDDRAACKAVFREFVLVCRHLDLFGRVLVAVDGTRIKAVNNKDRNVKQRVREQAAHVQRIQKTLEEANLKLASVLADIMGQSGRAVLEALVEGDPTTLSGLVNARVKAGHGTIRAALTGRIGDPHRFLLGLHLRQYDALAAAVAEIDAQVEHDLGPVRDAAGLLATIPGVSDLTAQVILFRDRPRHEPLSHRRPPDLLGRISWAGLCPRNDESAGKRRSTRLKKGAPWLKTTLVQWAWAAARKKQSYLQAQFQRLRHRRGPKKAVCAVAASILTAAYHMLKDGTVYADLGPDHVQRRAPEQRARTLAREIERLGFTCAIAPTEPVSI